MEKSDGRGSINDGCGWNPIGGGNPVSNGGGEEAGICALLAGVGIEDEKPGLRASIWVYVDSGAMPG